MRARLTLLLALLLPLLTGCGLFGGSWDVRMEVLGNGTAAVTTKFAGEPDAGTTTETTLPFSAARNVGFGFNRVDVRGAAPAPHVGCWWTAWCARSRPWTPPETPRAWPTTKTLDRHLPQPARTASTRAGWRRDGAARHQGRRSHRTRRHRPFRGRWHRPGHDHDAPQGHLVSVFGDTFRRAGVGGRGWRAPVVLFADPTSVPTGLRWTGSCWTRHLRPPGRAVHAPRLAPLGLAAAAGDDRPAHRRPHRRRRHVPARHGVP